MLIALEKRSLNGLDKDRWMIPWKVELLCWAVQAQRFMAFELSGLKNSSSILCSILLCTCNKCDCLEVSGFVSVLQNTFWPTVAFDSG